MIDRADYSCMVAEMYLGRFLSQWAHQSSDHVLHSHLRRAMNRFERAASTFSLHLFQHTPQSGLFKPLCCLMTRIGCSPLALICATTSRNRAGYCGFDQIIHRSSGVSGIPRRMATWILRPFIRSPLNSLVASIRIDHGFLAVQATSRWGEVINMGICGFHSVDAALSLCTP